MLSPARSAPVARSPESDDPFEGGPLARYRANFASILDEVRTILAPEGLLLTDARALRLVATGPTRPTAIAHRLDLSPAAVTQLLDRLEGRGFVHRAVDPNDRRSTVISLTREGTRTYRRAVGEIRGLVRQISGELGPQGLAAVERGSEELERALLRRRERRPR